MERSFIERTDFPSARRGWDPDAVSAHLRSVADEVEREASRAKAQATPGGRAADQVRAIVEAAEASAAAIVERAEAEAERMADQAKADAGATRDRSKATAARYLEEVEAAGERLKERADQTEADFEQMLAGLRSAGEGLMDRLRGGAGEIQGRVDAILGGLSGLSAEWEEEDVDEEEDEGHEPDLDEDGDEDMDDVDAAATSAASPGDADEGNGHPSDESARLIALNMALGGTPREETAQYLAKNYPQADADSILEDVYSRV
jgi:hypothetical protein